MTSLLSIFLALINCAALGSFGAEGRGISLKPIVISRKQFGWTRNVTNCYDRHVRFETFVPNAFQWTRKWECIMLSIEVDNLVEGNDTVYYLGNPLINPEPYFFKLSPDGKSPKGIPLVGNYSYPKTTTVSPKIIDVYTSSNETVTTSAGPKTTTTTTTTTATTTTTMTTTTVGECLSTVMSNQIENVKASTIYGDDKIKFGPQFAIDGKLSESSGNFYHSDEERQPWLQLTFTSPFSVTGVTITNRASRAPDASERLRNLDVRVGSKALTKSGEVSSNPLCGFFKGPSTSLATEEIPCNTPLTGKYLSVQLHDEQVARVLHINEITVGCTNTEATRTEEETLTKKEKDCVNEKTIYNPMKVQGKVANSGRNQVEDFRLCQYICHYHVNVKDWCQSWNFVKVFGMCILYEADLRNSSLPNPTAIAGIKSPNCQLEPDNKELKEAAESIDINVIDPAITLVGKAATSKSSPKPTPVTSAGTEVTDEEKKAIDIEDKKPGSAISTTIVPKLGQVTGTGIQADDCNRKHKAFGDTANARVMVGEEVIEEECSHACYYDPKISPWCRAWSFSEKENRCFLFSEYSTPGSEVLHVKSGIRDDIICRKNIYYEQKIQHKTGSWKLDPSYSGNKEKDDNFFEVNEEVTTEEPTTPKATTEKEDDAIFDMLK